MITVTIAKTSELQSTNAENSQGISRESIAQIVHVLVVAKAENKLILHTTAVLELYAQQLLLQTP